MKNLTDMSALESKVALGAELRWDKSFLDADLFRQEFPFHYFIETPLLGRPDAAHELDRTLSMFAEGSVFSVGYERDGTFDVARADETSWSVDDGQPFTGAGVREYLAKTDVGLWDGLLIARSRGGEWIFFEDPAEPVAILATRAALSQMSPDEDLIFDARRLVELIDSHALGFTEVASERFHAAYAQELGPP